MKKYIGLENYDELQPSCFEEIKADGFILGDPFCQRRMFRYGDGDMLELVRYQTKTLAKAAGAESDYEFLSFAKVKASEKNNNYAIGKYYDQLQVSVENDKIAKQFNLRRTIRNFL